MFHWLDKICVHINVDIDGFISLSSARCPIYRGNFYPPIPKSYARFLPLVRRCFPWRSVPEKAGA